MFPAVLALLLFGYQLMVAAVDVNDIKIEEYNDYVLLASDVQEYHKASSVFIIYAGNDQSIRTTSLMAHLTREFSSKFVLSVCLNYTDISQHHAHYQKRIVRPLFVVLLSSAEEVGLFQRVARSYDMSYPFWLIIFTEPILDICARPSGNFFGLAFDTEMMVKCYGDPELREWYGLHGDRTEIQPLASWDAEGRLRPRTSKSLYERRHTLAGRRLRIATVRDSPFISAQQGPLAGLFGEILNELSASLNFTLEQAHKEDNYGMFNETTGRWSGVIGRLVSRDVDLGVAEITMTGQRLDVVDFTLPIMLSRNHLYMRQPEGSALQWSAYFRVYTTDVWFAIEGMYALSAFIITYMRLKMKDKPIPPNHLSENYLCVWGIYCQQGLPEFPNASAMRIAYFSILVTAVILLAIYSACLISYLTVTSPSLPFSNLEEFANDGSYKLIAFQQSADYDMFATSKDRVLKKMMKQMRDRQYLPKTMMNGFRQACGNKVAFYATEAVKTQISARIPCNLVFLESGRIDSLSMTLTKGNQYTGVINFHLQKFKDLGIMNRLRSSVYKKVIPLDNKYSPVHFMGIVTILVILGTGVVASIVLLVLEIAMHRIRLAKEKRRISCSYNKSMEIAKNNFL